MPYNSLIAIIFSLSLATNDFFMKTLTARKRDKKIKLDTLRGDGNVPAVFYGRKTDSTPIYVSYSDFIKLWREVGESGMFQLKDGGDEHNALIHEVQIHPVSGEPVHVDFYVVEKGQKVTVDIPIEFTGVSPAVEDLGASFVKVLHEIEVEAEPHKLPHDITVDISSLKEFHDQITIADLTPPEGVVFTEEMDEVVCLVQEPREEEEEEEETAPIDLEAIEVEGEAREAVEGEASDEKQADGGEGKAPEKEE